MRKQSTVELFLGNLMMEPAFKGKNNFGSKKLGQNKISILF